MIEKRYNILIVEDEWISANYINEILKILNQNIIAIVSNAKDAFKYLKKNSIDFIFMDINIDGAEDGITLAHKVNQQYKIPIIYMTAFGDSNTIEEAIETNIYGFIIKPFMEKDVETVFNVAIQRVRNEYRYQNCKPNLKNHIINLGSGYTFNSKDSSLFHNNIHINLSKNEIKLLRLLSINHGQVIPIDTIRNTIWKEKEIGESTIRDTISRLRKKIMPLHLKNVIGMGYILK